MNTPQMSDERSFPRRHALTRGFTLGAPRNIRVSADGQRVAFLRSSGPVDSVNSLWLFDVLAGTERLVVDAAEFAADRADLHGGGAGSPGARPGIRWRDCFL